MGLKKQNVVITNQKDKQIIKDSIDAIVLSVPGLNVAWGLSQALCGAGLKLRQRKALEWVEMVRDNPAILTEEILNDENFQDGFVYSLEKYLIERNEEKRKYFRNIFLGYSENNKNPEFELEKFIHILSQLSDGDMIVLSWVDINAGSSYQIIGDTDVFLENISNLIALGILYNDPTPRAGPVSSPYVFTSDVGKRLIQYLR